MQMALSRALSCAAVIAAMAAAVGCGSSDTTSATGSSGDAVAAKQGETVDAVSLIPEREAVLAYGDGAGLSSTGETPIVYTDPEEGLELTAELAEKARNGQFKVGVLMHTLQLDWSTLEMNGIKNTLKKYGAEVIGPAVAEWDPQAQAANIQDMIQQKPDAIIGISVDTSATAPAFESIQKAGIPLILMIQAPDGLEHGADYGTVVANEAVREGATAAAILSPDIPEGGTVLCSCFGTPFWSVDERERGFKFWFEANRPDVKIKEVEWLDAADAGQVTADFLTANPDVDGVFTPWDAPGMQVVGAMRQQGKELPMTTVDIGTAAAIDVASGGPMKGIMGQPAYDLGVAQALAAIRAILGEDLAPFYIVPPYPAVQNNVLKAYEEIWRAKPPKELVDACAANEQCAAGEDNQPYLSAR